MAVKILKRSDLSQKDFKVDTGLLRIKDSSFFIISDDGFGVAVFNIGSPLDNWVKPVNPKVNATAIVAFSLGLAHYVWNGLVWHYKFFANTTSTLSTVPYTYKVANYTIQNTDRKIECNGTFDITIPLLPAITHYEDISVTNGGVGIITLKTTNPDTISGETEIDIEPLETIRFQKGQSQYIII